MFILNPGQVPFLTCNQTLYVITKKIQWNWPSTHGVKTELVVMFRGLHIELAAIRNRFEESGWTNALVQGEVTTPGIADSFLKATHASRTGHAHQVTAAALDIQMHKAHELNLCRLMYGTTNDKLKVHISSTGRKP